MSAAAPSWDLVAITRFLNQEGKNTLKLETSGIEVSSKENHLTSIIQTIKPILKRPRFTKRYEFHIYHTTHLTPSDIAEIEKEICIAYQQPEFGQGRRPPKIIFHYSGVPGMTPEAMAGAIDNSIENPEEPTAKALTPEEKKILHDLNREALTENKTWMQRITQPHLTPKIIFAFASVRAALTAGMRIFQLASEEVPVSDEDLTGSISARISLVIFDTTKDFLTVFYQRAIGRFFCEHRLPIPLATEFLKRVNEVYKKNGVAQFLKVAVMNLLLNGVGLPLMNQWIATEAGLKGVHSPEWKDVGKLALNSAVGTLAFSSAYVSAQILRKKGQVSQNRIDLTFQLPGIPDSIANVFRSIPSLFNLAYAIQVPVWSAYLLSLVPAWMAPHRNRQIILIENGDLASREFANQHHLLVETVRIETSKDFSLLKTFSEDLESKQLKKSGPSLWCANRLLRWVKRRKFW